MNALRSRRRIALGLALAVAVLLLTGAGPAHAAGTYTAYLCKLPNGDPAPSGPWTGTFLSDSCASGGDLTARLPNGVIPNGYATASLTAPADTTIARAELWRDYSLPVSSDQAQPSLSSSWETRGYGGGNYSGDSGSTPYVAPHGAFAANAGLVRSGPLNSLSATVTCTPNGATSPNDCSAGGSWSLHKLDLLLSDPSAPSVTSPPSGELLDGTWHTTVSTGLDLGASDTGGGAYRAFVREGSTTVYAALDGASTTCKDAASGNANAYEFAGLAPCRTGTTAYHPVFDLSGLGDGTHTVSVGVEDAAGNETIPSGFAAKTVRVNTPGGSLGDPGVACSGGGTYNEAGVCSTTGGTTPPPSGGGGGGSVTPVGGGSSSGGSSGGGGGGSSSAAPAAATPAAAAPAPSASASSLPDAHRANGLNASAGGSLVGRFSTTEKRQLRVGYGKPVTLTGQLVNARGVPVSHGTVEVITYTRLPGAQPVRLAPVVSDDQGTSA